VIGLEVHARAIAVDEGRAAAALAISARRARGTGVPARAAIGRIRLPVALAAVEEQVGVAVGETGGALVGAHTAHAEQRGHVVAGAGLAAAATVEWINIDERVAAAVAGRSAVAAVVELVVVAVAMAGRSGARAGAGSALRDGDVVGRADRGARATVPKIAGDPGAAAGVGAAPPQSAKPAPQVGVQTPAVQPGVATLVAPQATPQPPQWSGLVSRSISQPLAGLCHRRTTAAPIGRVWPPS
jgi:hypothetical protein